MDKPAEEVKYLYHGTTAAVARKVLEEGLKTRATTGSKGNWDHTIPSPEDRVYLTNSYAGYFALSATEEAWDPWGIVEVDVSQIEHALFPDEDFLEQATRNQEVPVDGWQGDFYKDLHAANSITDGCQKMAARTEWYKENILGFQQHWGDSVRGLGNCCHMGDIPPEAISRVVIFDPKKNKDIAHMVDPCISLMNYHICGEKYREITKWLAGYDVNPAALCGLFFPEAKIPISALSQEQVEALPESVRQPVVEASRVEQQMIDALEHYKANVIPNREGLEVILP